jgi:predicted aminopeptidase
MRRPNALKPHTIGDKPLRQAMRADLISYSTTWIPTLVSLCNDEANDFLMWYARIRFAEQLDVSHAIE